MIYNRKKKNILRTLVTWQKGLLVLKLCIFFYIKVVGSTTRAQVKASVGWGEVDTEREQEEAPLFLLLFLFFSSSNLTCLLFVSVFLIFSILTSSIVVCPPTLLVFLGTAQYNMYTHCQHDIILYSNRYIITLTCAQFEDNFPCRA